MVKLEPPNSHCLRAAIGWLELGSAAEARRELDGVSAALQNNPEVLEIRWLICAEENNWEEALVTARGLIEIAPERSAGWVHQAYALRRVVGGGLPAAWDALLPAAEMFPGDPIIPYNLACYACQMNLPAETLSWLRRALTTGNTGIIKQMALADPDLEPLREEIRAL